MSDGETEPTAKEKELRQKIRAIMANPDLTMQEKGRQMQELHTGKWKAEDEGSDADAEGEASGQKDKENAILDEDSLKCVFCSNLCNRPVTAPCGHNFCLDCFGKWCAKGNKACPTCRTKIPPAFAANPRINTALTTAIRLAKQGVQKSSRAEQERIANADRPDEAFTTERAVRSGRANAASGRIMVTTPSDHFGPIPAEADPRGTGVRVGEWWKDRMDCRQWGAHLPHVAGIAGQSDVGAQSVVLSGGYEDDRDEGEWFLYTGSGGRDLSGNKRTNKVQSSDQKFESMNKALQASCQRGLPVRVVRSHKEKRSAYAPTTETPVRYDGVYRIHACWRRPGNQGPLVCRYLFMRCDNEPAPWSSEETGDKPAEEEQVPADARKDMKQAKGPVIRMSDKPWWGWKEAEEEWGWTRDPPASRKRDDPTSSRAKRKQASQHERALREFTCGICKCILEQPMVMPCNHAFCKPCLLKQFEGIPDVESNSHGRAMRVRKVQKPCPQCKVDCAPYLKDAQVNHEMASVIVRLQAAARAAQDGDAETADAEAAAAADAAAAAGGATAEAAAAGGVDVAAAAAADGAAAKDASSSDDAAEHAALAADGDATAAPPPAVSGAAPAAAAAASAGSSDAEVLASEFPEVDASLISMLLEDQGGDAKEVRFYLQRMQNAEAAAKKKEEAAARKAAKAAAAANGKSPASPSKANGTAAAAEADDAEAAPATANGKAAGRKWEADVSSADKAAKRQHIE